MKRIAFALIAALCSFLCTSLASAGVAIQQWQTSNGARVLFVESRALPILDVQVDFAAGSMFDPVGKSGLAALTRATLDLGAGSLDENAIADRLADIGANLSGGADTDKATISLRTLVAPERRDPALEILRTILKAPRFEADIVARERDSAIANLKETLSRPDGLAGKAFWSALYPQHPYGRQASPASIAGLQRADLQAFQQRYYVARNANITIVGDISRAEAETIATTLTAELAGGAPAPLPAPPAAPKGGQQKIAHPASQAHIHIGLPAIEKGNPDTYALSVGNYTLGGGGFVSRLMKEVRDKRGYVYDIHSYFNPLRQNGPFQISLQTKRSQAGDALKLSRLLLDDFLRSGPSDEELAAAKANLIGSFPLRLDSNKKIVENVANIGFYGLPLDYLDQYQAKIAAVTAADVRRAFAKHVQATHLITIVVGSD